jgi:hypothetical protein
MTSEPEPFFVEFMMDEPSGEATPVAIREDQLPSLTRAELRRLHISPKEIRRVFAKARELMRERNVKPGDRIRPCADEMLNGDFIVALVRYSERTDPLMRDPPAGNA